MVYGEVAIYYKDIMNYSRIYKLIIDISVAEAKRQTGINSIMGALRSKWSTAGGYIWKYNTKNAKK